MVSIKKLSRYINPRNNTTHVLVVRLIPITQNLFKNKHFLWRLRWRFCESFIMFMPWQKKVLRYVQQAKILWNNVLHLFYDSLTSRFSPTKYCYWEVILNFILTIPEMETNVYCVITRKRQNYNFQFIERTVFLMK